jgi:glycosyltransferase involved in cell wall biosynthesis
MWGQSLKIALFHTTLPEPGRKPGGVEIAVHRLANELARCKEDEVTVLSLTGRPPDARYAHRQLFADRPALRTNQALRLIGLPVLLNFAPLDGYDVVHLHGDDWFLLNRKGPTVRTLHGSALYEARSATSWKRRLSQYLVYPLEHLARRLATVPLAVGPETARIYGIPDLANNGVDTGVFRPGPKADHPQVLYVGTWEGRKRGRFIFEQFVERVLPACPKAELIMVCDRQPDHPNVRSVHFPDDETLAALYRSAWVFAYPSVYEGFGIPYIEAMASGTAVLCSPNDGARYVLENGAFGCIAEDASFAGSLIELLSHHEKRGAMIEKGLARAAGFTWSAVAEQHRRIYREAIDRTRDGAEAVNAPFKELHEH